MLSGKRMRELRKSKELTQESLGKLLNVGKSTISQYENSINQPDIETVVKMADIFNVSVDYLLGKTDAKTPAVAQNQAEILTDILKAVPDLTEEEKESLEEHMEFALKQIQKARQQRENTVK